jgi:hypothetical protein
MVVPVSDVMWPKRLVIDWPSTGAATEDVLLYKEAEERGIPIIKSSRKQMERNRTPITPDDLVAGSIPFIIQALHKLKIDVPLEMSYPPSLHPWLHRRVTRDVLWRVRQRLAYAQEPIFIKPAEEGWKKFTGFVAMDANDYRIVKASKYTPIWTSNPIKIQSEWRAYVVMGEIRSIQYYDGDVHIQPDREEIARAVTTVVLSNEAPPAFAIDFGVDGEGNTILIELNGGFSVGAYGDVSSKDYWDMAATYWYFLTRPAFSRKISLSTALSSLGESCCE